MLEQQPQPKIKVEPAPGYQFDQKGIQVRHDEYGAWKELDVEGGQLIAQNAAVIKERAYHRARINPSSLPSFNPKGIFRNFR